MGGRALPTECPHGRIIDPGDFGDRAEGCETCGIPAATWDDDGNMVEAKPVDFGAWCAEIADLLGIPASTVEAIAWSYAAFVLRRVVNYRNPEVQT